MKKVSEVLISILALSWHFCLGIVRLIIALIGAIIMITGLVLITCKILFRRFWKLFSRGYQETWNSLYSKLGKPECEICGRSKTSELVIHTHTHGWVHKSCFAAKKIALEIHEGNLQTAAAHMLLCREAKLPQAFKVIVRSLRELYPPNKPGLYKRISHVRDMSNDMTFFDALLLATIG